jgi:hypothetical protein
MTGPCEGSQCGLLSGDGVDFLAYKLDDFGDEKAAVHLDKVNGIWLTTGARKNPLYARPALTLRALRWP